MSLRKVLLFVWFVVGESTPKGIVRSKVGRQPPGGEGFTAEKAQSCRMTAIL